MGNQVPTGGNGFAHLISGKIPFNFEVINLGKNKSAPEVSPLLLWLSCKTHTPGIKPTVEIILGDEDCKLSVKLKIIIIFSLNLGVTLQI